MSKKTTMSRRTFLSAAALAVGGMATGTGQVQAAGDITRKWNSRKKPGFTMWQIPSHKDTIGNSYVFRTTTGKVIVMDGGFAEEEFTLRGFIGALGNEVEAWFISHPHEDHMGAMNEIVKNPQDIRIKSIYHSRISEAVRKAEKDSAEHCREYYENLDKSTTIHVEDIRQPGREFQFDDMHLKILSVANDDLLMNPYNNSSMIMRVWDRRKSIVFLGDAGVECGDKVLNSSYRNDLDCEYLQMAHHGQNGCSKQFYDAVKFRACLWSTPLWVWDNKPGHLKTLEVRAWMEELGIMEHHVSCLDGLYRLD